MPIVTVDPGIEQSPYCQPADNVPAKVVGARRQEIPGERNKGKFYVRITVNFKSPETGDYILADTRPWGAGNTSLEVNSGSSWRKFASQLGLNPDAFETDDEGNVPELLNKEVLANIGMRTYEQEGETKHANFVKDLMKA